MRLVAVVVAALLLVAGLVSRVATDAEWAMIGLVFVAGLLGLLAAASARL